MILVTGSTSRIGREVVHDLVLKDVQIRVMMFGGAGNEWENWSNVETMLGDFGKRETVDAALEGIDTAFLLSSAGPRHVELQSAFIDACARAGVKHIVKISMLGADAASNVRFLKRHGESEAHLLRSGLRATIVRPNVFMQNVLNSRTSILDEQKMFGSLASATAVSMVDSRDVAHVAAIKLLEPTGANATVDLAGPLAITQPEVAAAIANVLGKPVSYVELSADAFAERLAGIPVPRDAAEGTIELNAWFNAGNGATRDATIETLLGRAPTSFDAYVQKVQNRFYDAP